MANHRHPPTAESRYPQSELKGTVTVVGDIVGPILPEHRWASLANALTPVDTVRKGDSGNKWHPKDRST